MRRLGRTFFALVRGVIPLASALLAAYGPAAADDLSYCRQGDRAQDTGDHDLAISHYTRCLDYGGLSNENRGVTFNNRGIAHASKGAYDGAIADYGQALRLDHGDAVAFNNRGLAYAAKGAYDQAIADYEQALRLDAGYAAALHNRGHAYYLTDAYERAIADYDQAIRVDPNLAVAFDSRGRLHFYLGRFSAAVPDLARAAELAPDNAYRAVWLYIARARAGHGGRSGLRGHDGGAWPGPVVAMLLGKTSTEAPLAAAGDPNPETRNAQLCEAHFYVGQKLLLEGHSEAAADHFRAAVETSVTGFIEYAGAKAELKRLGY